MNLIIKGSETLGDILKEMSFSKNTLGRTFIDIVYFPSEYLKIKNQYYKLVGKKLNLIFPKSFNEHIQHSKLFWRKGRYIWLADKIKCREFVEKEIGSDYLTKVFWSGGDLREAMKVELPDSFIIKPNHSSGVSIIVRDKNNFDWDAALKETQEWLNIDYSKSFSEWQYRWIKPNLLIEELLINEEGKIPEDFKFFCFNGNVKFLQIDFDRFTSHTRSFYNSKFELMPFGLVYPRFPGKVEKPKNFELMKKLAEKLAKQEVFVRVDFFEIGKPIFGEITFHPEAGLGKFFPDNWDLKIGHYFKKRQ